MVAHSILAIIAVIAVAGLGTAAATGMLTPSAVGSINLGTLSPGQAGNATTTATVHVTNATTYKIGLEKRDLIGSVFSKFMVSVSVDGHTYNITNEPGNTPLKLNNGTYSFNVKISFEVRNIVHSANETKIPFLFLHPAEMENESGEHDFGKTGSNNNTQDFASIGTIQSMDNKSGNDINQGNNESGDTGSNAVAIASFSFHVNGNAGNHNENESSDYARSMPLPVKYSY